MILRSLWMYVNWSKRERDKGKARHSFIPDIPKTLRKLIVAAQSVALGIVGVKDGQ